MSYTSQDGITRTIIVSVSVPTPTPLPPPIVERYNVNPLEITAGDKVQIQWTVANVDGVAIDPLGEFPPDGSIEDQPGQTTTYVLRATNGQVAIEPVLREVIVNPAPTATPVPGAPIIEFFTSSPSEVDLGSTAADAVVLAWSVVPFHQSDSVTVELSGPVFGIISGLQQQGSQSISVDVDTQIVLTAAHGDLSVSQSVEVKVNILAPAITALTPSLSTAVGASSLSVTVTGSNFVTGAAVQVNGVDRSTVFVSSTTLTVSLISADMAEPTTLTLTVKNPVAAGGGTSNGSTFVLNNPVPVIASTGVDPASATAGDPDTIVRVSGSSFVTDSTVRFDGTDRSTTYSGSSSLSTIFKAADVSIAGTYPITVFNPEPGGGSSGVFTFTVNNPAPTITSIGPPTETVVGGGTFQFVITGTGYVDDNPGSPGTTVAWNSDIIPSTFDSDTQLTATIDESRITSAGTVQITLTNATPGGGTTGDTPYIVGKDVTTTTLSASINPAKHQQSIILTATVTGTGNGTQAEPTGFMTITINDSSGTLVSTENLPLTDVTPDTPYTNTATKEYFRDASGSPYKITAVYDGDGNFATSTSVEFTLNVDKADTTVTWIGASPEPAVLNQSVVLEIDINPVNPGGGTVAGTVRIREGTTTICDITLPSTACTGAASLFSSLGTHNLVAIYPEPGITNDNYNGSESTTFALQVKETPTISTTASPGLSLSYSSLQAYTYTTTLTGVGGTPTGAVTFSVGGNDISGCASVGLVGGVASCTTTTGFFNAGSYTIKVEYAGAGDFNGVTDTFVQSISKVTPTLLFSPSSVKAYEWILDGGSVTATATVFSVVGVPSGTMSITGIRDACGSHTIDHSINTTVYNTNTVSSEHTEDNANAISHKLRKRERCQGGVAEHKIVECGDERHTPHSKQEAQKEFGAAYACDSI